MNAVSVQRGRRRAVTTVSVWLCLTLAAPAVLFAAGADMHGDPVIGSKSLKRAGDSGPLVQHDSIHPGTPLILDPQVGSFSFDVGESKTRKLQIDLGQPIMLQSRSQSQSGPDSALFGLDATVRLPLAGGLSLAGSAEHVVGISQFQSLGSIQCMNGTLRPDSYTASGCRFIDDSRSGGAATEFDRRTLRFGGRQDLGNLSASLDWFTSQSEFGTPGMRRLNQWAPAPALDNRLLSPMPGSSSPVREPMSAPYLASEMNGIDLSFQVGITTDRSGSLQLGLAVTRVLDGSYSSLYDNTIEQMNWRLAEPFDSAALGIEWSNGVFSSGIRSYYRENVSFLNRENLDSMGTFDVHFTWRTPWNANLSIGTTNVLNAGVKETAVRDKPIDRFESIYGRIPYVRYQQDL